MFPTCKTKPIITYDKNCRFSWFIRYSEMWGQWWRESEGEKWTISEYFFFWLLPGFCKPRNAIQEQSISFFRIRPVQNLNQFEHFITNFFLDTRNFVRAWMNAGGWVDTHWGTTRCVGGPRTVVLFVFENCRWTIFRRLDWI